MANLAEKMGRRPIVGFGPKIPGSGSWEWVGADMAESLSQTWDVTVFNDQIPECDVFVFIKYKPRPDILREISKRTRIIYCPIDFYSSAAEIDNDAPSLLKCQHILIHCERLRKYFAPYATVEYIDHHVKFAAPMRRQFVEKGPLLWVGVHSNLPPLIEYVNSNELPGELWILTNANDDSRFPSHCKFGFRSDRSVRIESWTPDLHREWTSLCRAAIDVKGDDFRALHKPPAKGVDFIASGVPFALESDSSTAEYLREMGFEPTTPDNPGIWLSRGYWEETVKFGSAIREHLAKRRIANRFSQIIEHVLDRRSSHEAL